MMQGLWQKIQKGLEKTRETLTGRIESLFLDQPIVSLATLESLEEILIGADLGPAVTERLMAGLRASVTRKEVIDLIALQKKLKSYLITILEKGGVLMTPASPPIVTLFMGVNGVGKTTTLAKRAYQLKQSGKKVLLAAGDTFRAGAIEQLKIWGTRVGVEVIAHQAGGDPAAVAFDAARAACARGVDALFIDTAGRLQTNRNLMQELKKIKRVIGREIPENQQQQILVLDATTGQNALSQARLFHEAVGVSGLILTKLDTTAKGGMIIPIVEMLRAPVTHIGIGEKVDDLIPFDREAFVEALFTSVGTPTVKVHARI